MSFAPAERRQFAWITAGAIAVFVVLRLLPTGTNLSHMDFRVDPRAGNAIEFCDPLNPQFIPVVAAKSPVTMSVTLGAPSTVRLATASGKPLRPEDLLITHTERLHLLIVDSTLQDYQHVHPQPTDKAGEWSFNFTPRRGGVYRFFADFTPVATARGLYASADAEIDPAQTPLMKIEPPISRALRDGHDFTLVVSSQPARAGRPIDLQFTIRRPGPGILELQPVMGALAHLVAFDEARSGFAHLHPVDSDPLKGNDANGHTLNFKLTIPRAGRYTIWAQVNLGGSETFVPFALDVVE